MCLYKRGRPPLYDDSGYKQFEMMFQTDSKRNVQNNMYKAQAVSPLSDYVAAGNSIPHRKSEIKEKILKKFINNYFW